MFKIDIHTHILPPEIPNFKEKFGYGGFIKLHHHHRHGPSCGANCTLTQAADMLDDSGKFFRKVEANCYAENDRLIDCDRDGVHVQVLSTVPVMFSYWAKPLDGEYIAQFLNDHIKSVVEKFPKRFVGLGTLPMQDANLSVKEIFRIKKLGFRGVQIGSNINNLNLDDQSLFPIYEALEANELCLFVHPWEMMGQDKMPKYWLPWLVGMPAETSRAICSMIFGGVFTRFPKLKVAFAHGGGSFPLTIGRVEHGFVSRPDLCAIDNPVNPRNYLGKFFIDSLVHDPDALKFVVKMMGEDKVMLGTDYPFPLGENVPGKLIMESDFNNEIKAKLLSTNALNWLGLNKEYFL